MPFKRFLVLLAVVACGAPVEEPEDSGVPEVDAGERDAGTPDGGTADAGTTDAGTADAGQSPADAGPDRRPVLYPYGRTHSPITESVAANLRRISRQAAPKLSKVGDSNTVNTGYLNCFAGAGVDLASNTELQPVLDAYRDGGTLNRTSQAATVGWSAQAALAGNPSPLTQELASVNPRYATVMFGTNDIQAMNVDTYGRNMFAIADQLIASGVIPILTAVPPRDDNATADLAVPRYNAVARGIAQARQVPFIDLERELRTLPNHGIGSDGLHLTIAPTGACKLDQPYGHNRRNLLTLQSLHRAEGAPPDATATHQQGSGTPADPFVIPSLPYVDLRDTRTEGTNVISAYSGCTAAQDESGPELYYRLNLTVPTNLRAYVIALDTADVDIHLLSGTSASECVTRNDKLITRTSTSGTLYLSLDTFQNKRGEYLLVVLEDP